MRKATKNILVISAVLVLIAGVVYTTFGLNKTRQTTSENKEKNDRRIIIDNKNA